MRDLGRPSISPFDVAEGTSFVIALANRFSESAARDDKGKGGAPREVEAEESVPFRPPGRVPHVCAGVAGALHGLNEMGRSPFRCCLSRAAKPNKEKSITRRLGRCEAEPNFLESAAMVKNSAVFLNAPDTTRQKCLSLNVDIPGPSLNMNRRVLRRGHKPGKVLDTGRPLNYKAK